MTSTATSLSVKFSTGARELDSGDLEIPVNPSTSTIRHIKATIEESSAISAPFQRLIYMGKILDEPDTIVSNFLSDKSSTIHVAPSSVEATAHFRAVHRRDTTYRTGNRDKMTIQILFGGRLRFRGRDDKRKRPVEVSASTTVEELHTLLWSDASNFDGFNSFRFVGISERTQILLLHNGVGLVRRDFALSDYDVVDGSVLHVLPRYRARRGNGWSKAHERRNDRLVCPILLSDHIPPSCYPFFLARKDINQPDALFHAARNLNERCFGGLDAGLAQTQAL